MGTIEAALAQAIRHHHAGALPQAEQIYRQILQAHPNHPEALHLLGVVAHQMGNHAAAVELIGAALRCQPGKAVYLCNLANACEALGQRDEALAHLRRAVSLEPSWAAGHLQLANLLRGRGQLDEAAACYRRVLELKPDHVGAWFALGRVHHKQGRLDEAAACYLEAIRLKPDHAEAQNNLGSLYQEQGRLEEAEACYRQACRVRPDAAEIAHNLGHVRRARGDLAEAVAWYRKAAHLQPAHAEAYDDLGAALSELGLLTEAVAAFQQALALRPACPATHCNLGKAWRVLGRPDKAIAFLREALRLDPTLVEAHHQLGEVLADQRQQEEAVVCFRAALRLKPNCPTLLSSLAYVLTMVGETHEAVALWEQALEAAPDNRLRLELATQLPPLYASMAELESCRARLREGLKALHAQGVTIDLKDKPTRPLFFLAYQGLNDRTIQRDYARLHTAPPVALRAATVPRTGAGEKMRVGFLSSHFREHTIGHLTQGLIAHLSRARFSVTVLSVGAHRDPVADAIRASADHFVEVAKNLPAARRLIADQALDILYYPDIGMDPFTHALAFSRLAPVQCVSWGHPDTTGIETIDYFISSAALETDEAEPQYTETLIRLDDLPVYYYRPSLPAAAGGRAAFDFSADDHLYACPQSLFKLHPDFDEMVAGILRGDPRGLLVLIQGMNPQWERLFRQRFATAYPELESRVRVLPGMSRDAFLNLMVQADVLLDPLHFGGGNSSYEGLAMGTPIVTLPSPFLRGRITYALYRQMGMMECVVRTPREYVDLALKIGTDPAYRASLRAKIMAQSGVLYENDAGVRDLERFFGEVLS